MAYAKPERELALALLRAGASVTKVATQLGVSRRSVQRWRVLMLEDSTAISSPEAGGVSPEFTLASIATDSRMPAGARVQAAKSLIDLTPRAAPAVVSSPEMTEFECFDVSIMAATVYVEALQSGRHALSEGELQDLQQGVENLRRVLEIAPDAGICPDPPRSPESRNESP